jgi:hypothetical protein
MNRYLLALLLIAFPAHFSRTQPKQNPVESPTVTISLPEDIPSETVQIHYLMIGSFGGYGGFIEPKPNQTDYEIDASTQGKPSDSIKILVYATGCKFQTFDLELMQVPNPKVRFVCEPLPQIRIDGEIPSALMRHENAELNVRYIAFWASRFFGIADGPVIEFQVATTTPDLDGNFRVDIPDFSADNKDSTYPGGASLGFTLRDSKTLNLIALNLSPERTEYQSETQGLRILPSYPAGLKFVNSRESPDSAGDFTARPLNQPNKNASLAVPR